MAIPEPGSNVPSVEQENARLRAIAYKNIAQNRFNAKMLLAQNAAERVAGNFQASRLVDDPTLVTQVSSLPKKGNIAGWLNSGPRLLRMDAEGAQRVREGEDALTPDSTVAGHSNLYRGLTKTMKQVALDQVGRHWSIDPKVAHNFALKQDPEVDEVNGTSAVAKGTVLSARVPWGKIVEPHTPEWQQLSTKHVIFPRKDPEKEHTLRDGDKVNIRSVTPISRVYSDYDPEEPRFNQEYDDIKGNPLTWREPNALKGTI